MARLLRIEYTGALYHITSRGNQREAIYLADSDREMWLEVFRWFNWICHAYCLMDNHYHLLVETPKGNLSLGVRQLNGEVGKELTLEQPSGNGRLGDGSFLVANRLDIQCVL